MIRTLMTPWALLILCTPLVAQNPDYTIFATSAAGSPGEIATVEIVLDHSGDPVQGWSFSVCHDPALVLPSSADIGAGAAALNGGMGPDYFFAEARTEGFHCQAVISFIGGITLPAGVASLMEANYLLSGAVGTTSIDLCDVVGDPPTLTLLSVNQLVVIPVTDSGEIEVSGTPIPPALEFSLQNPSTTFDPDTGVGDFTASAFIEQTVGFPANTVGFSMGVAHDPGFLEAVTATPDGPLSDLNGGSGPEFFGVNIFADGITIEVEYTAAGTETIFFADVTPVAEIQYVTNAATLMGTMTVVTTPLSFVDILGTPPVINEVIHGSPPMTLIPDVVDGAVTLTPLGAPPPTGDYLVRGLDVTVPSGAPADVSVLLDSGGGIVQGWSWGLCHNGMELTLTGVEQGSTVMTVNGGNPPDFYATEEFASTGWTVGCVVNFTGTNGLPPGSGHVMNVASYDVLIGDGESSQLDFCETLGSPPVQISVVVLGVASMPDTESITVEVEDPSVPFIRGDADGNGLFNGLIDGVFVLQFQFIPGSPAPPCMDAADADDDGSVNGLVDGVRVLNFQFIPGTPVPPAPGPSSCGADPTDDPLDCDDHACP